MDKTPVLAKQLAKIVFRRNSVSPVRLNVGEVVEKRFSSERKSPCLNRFRCKNNPPTRRALNFDSFSPLEKQTALPSILLDGVKIDFNNSTEFLNKIKTVSSSPKTETPIFHTSILETGSPIRGTPILNTPEKQAILENGKSKSWPVIGKGNFGTVMKARHKGKRVAVKIIPKNNSPRKESLRRERHALELNHPNIVNMISVINSPNTKFGIVLMELWNSIDLQEVLDDHERELTFLQKVCCSLDVCQALSHCHEKKIVHLDVKPKNILIHKMGWISKICDFGSSISITDMERYKYCPRHQGTIQYMAPEMFRGSTTVTEKADVYSLGITMWQLMSEETPYKGEDLHTVIYKVVSQNYRPSSSNLQTMDQNFISLYGECWLGDHTNRPTTSEISKRLSKILEENNFKSDVKC
ncbi:serine/threonine-protein kinase mos-like [Nilaparvata lugens]|uniref:serine/threonine-protein kinase mos-like n=1 Tax=Nilaparvata lugens TaxID=108931 RepID=UPI00193C9AFF|nr:serine/threonine-protein kinase mos-like [Nilaparvata lugens]